MGGSSKSGAAYKNLPVEVSFAPARADALYMALRSAASLSGLLTTSCDNATGPASVKSLDSHVVGCHVAGGADCDATEAAFVDSNRPVYEITSALFEAVRVPSDAACPAVRSALP